MSAKKVRNKTNVHKSRKQLRKEERKNKKIRRHEFYTNRKKPGQFVLVKKEEKFGSKEQNNKKQQSSQITKKEVHNEGKKMVTSNPLNSESLREKEKKQQVRLQKEMNKHRYKQLQEANIDEDRNIKKLEKQLKLNKKKSKSVPASFARDGLDYLLEVCDPENLKTSALAEQQLAEVNDEFEEDLVLMTESNTDKNTTVRRKRTKNTERTNNKKPRKDSSESDLSADDDGDDFDDSQSENSDIDHSDGSDLSDLDEDENSDRHEDETSDHDEDENNENSDDEDKSNEDSDSNKDENSDDNDDGNDASSKKETNDDTWEDIYGRLRTKDGSVINEKTQKYIPPGARMKPDDASTDNLRKQKLEKLRKQLKGLMNRLAESNMHNIATQIEELYMSNSRNDMNSTITNLIMDALVSHILAPERLLMEHVLLLVILHANVGTEVGAHFLQAVVKQFDDTFKTSTSIEDKKLDNIVIILAQLYNFKLFDSKLIYEIVDRLGDNFGEKDVECILHILRNVGFNLRKDNPVALKNLILTLQKKAANASDEVKDNSRVKFMLDILLAIKNNNVTKIPNYDTTYSEHLKKIMKSFIRKGNYVTQLNISLEDLLKVEEKGKWWVVGSAWTGNVADNDNNDENKPGKSNSFSKKLLELAAKQRMNTDTRRNIFCIIMSAEDYLDAFEKLLRLSLKNQQEREIIHVILHCCLQEKIYNPFYATLAQKFCEHDRKFQMTIKYSVWDKLKALKDHSGTQISHLAKLLSTLFIEKGLPISTLKIVQFSELDKVTLRFIRQILLGILLHDDLEVCKGVFEKVGQSDKLKMFRESLKLFLHHFLLRNLESQEIAEDRKKLLQQRVKAVEKLLRGKEGKLDF